MTPHRLLAWAFLLGSAFSVAGTLWAQLGATSATTLAGGQSHGALYTGVMLGALGLSAGVATPLTPRIAARYGTRRTFIAAGLLAASGWAVLGVIVLQADDPLVPLVIGVIITGALGSVGAVLTPVIARAYLGGTSLARAYSVRSVASGVGAAAGALTAAAVISATAPGWGLIGDAALSLPLVLLVMFAPPGVGFPPVRRRAESGGGAWSELAHSRALRRVAGLAAAVAICVVPMISMIVPIAQALRQSPLIPGAGFVLAGVALGRLATPALVTRLRAGRGDLSASLMAITGTGALMLVLAISALVFTGRVELAIWAVLAAGIGATRFASRSLTIGAAGGGVESGREVAGIAAVFMVGAISVPIGTLTWGVALSVMPPWAVLAVGACTIMLVAMYLRATQRRSNR